MAGKIPKFEISEDKKRRIIERAGVLGCDYGDGLNIKGERAARGPMPACSPDSFNAIVDAFRNEGIELMTEEMQEDMNKGLIGLHAGTALTGVGTCGGVAGACFIISYVVGVTFEELENDSNLLHAACYPCVDYVIDRFEETYGAFDCLRLRYNRVQRAVDFWDPDGRIWEMTFHDTQCNKCGPPGRTVEDRLNYPAAQAAAWGAEAICDLLVKEPAERMAFPEALRDIWSSYGDQPERARKMQELGFGLPNEKISYREFRKARLGKLDRPGTIKIPNIKPSIKKRKGS